MAIITKTTYGFVTQYYDTTIGKWTSQEFVAGDMVDYTDEANNNINDKGAKLPYLPFDMVQPTEDDSIEQLDDTKIVRLGGSDESPST